MSSMGLAVCISQETKAMAETTEIANPDRMMLESHPSRCAFDSVLSSTARKTDRIATPTKSKAGIGPLSSRLGRNRLDMRMATPAKGRPR
jgi:hypothetical protein